MSSKLKTITLSLILATTGSLTSSVHSSQLLALVLTGQPAPGTGGGSYATLGQLSINDFGDVAFNARVEGGATAGGVFVLSSTRTTPIAWVGQTAPVLGGRFTGFRSPVINNRGEIAFFAALNGNRSSTGIFLFSQGKLVPVAWEGQLIPGTKYGLMGFVNHTLNDSGTVVFTGRTFTAEAGNTHGIFAYSKGTLSTLVIPGQRASNDYPILHPGSPSLNSSGSVAFTDSVLAGPRGARSGAAIYLSSAGSISPVILRGQSVPGGAGTFSPSLGKGIASPSLNNRGSLSFVAATRDGSIAHGVFLSSSERVSEIARSGRLAPGASGTFEEFSAAFLNDEGVVLFSATIDTASTDPARRYSKGWFLSTGSTINALAIEGQTAPLGGGERFALLEDASLNNKGDVVLVAKLEGGSTSYAIFRSN